LAVCETKRPKCEMGHVEKGCLYRSACKTMTRQWTCYLLGRELINPLIDGLSESALEP
jgi:hypothetical protein